MRLGHTAHMDTTTPNMIDAVAAAIRWHGRTGERFTIRGTHTITERTDGTFDVYDQIDGDDVRIANRVTIDDALALTQ